MTGSWRDHVGKVVGVLVVASLAVVVVAGCTSPNEAEDSIGTQVVGTVADTTTLVSEPMATEPPATVTAATEQTTALYPDGLRNKRYCELVIVKKPSTDFIAEVWNTTGFSDCPQADWDAIDAATTAAAEGGLVVLKNGPRYWTLDTVTTAIRDTAARKTFGSLEMFLGTTLQFGTSFPAQSAYVIRSVPRVTVFHYRSGSSVFEITDAAGHVYVMQSYALIKDATLTIDNLASIGPKLALPEGWSYASRTLTADLDVPAVDGVATVIQDDLQNTYQLETN